MRVQETYHNSWLQQTWCYTKHRRFSLLKKYLIEKSLGLRDNKKTLLKCHFFDFRIGDLHPGAAQMCGLAFIAKHSCTAPNIVKIDAVNTSRQENVSAELQTFSKCKLLSHHHHHHRQNQVRYFTNC